MLFMSYSIGQITRLTSSLPASHRATPPDSQLSMFASHLWLQSSLGWCKLVCLLVWFLWSWWLLVRIIICKIGRGMRMLLLGRLKLRMLFRMISWIWRIKSMLDFGMSFESWLEGFRHAFARKLGIFGTAWEDQECFSYIERNWSRYFQACRRLWEYRKWD